MRVLRVTAPCQLSLGLVEVSASRWQCLPEEIRHQVLALLARLIANGIVLDSDRCAGVELDDA